jgi:hypothetical protein
MPSEFKIRDPEVEAVLKHIGGMVGDSIKHAAPGYGFALLIFEFEGKNLFYMSSAERPNVLDLLQEFINQQRATLRRPN